jgi:hypothetical protein
MTYIIQDSSVWPDLGSSLQDKHTETIKIGLVREQLYLEEADTYFYMVEALSQGKRLMMRCRVASRFGDVYNYEEWTPRFNKVTAPKGDPEPWGYKVRTGEVVIVAAIDGLHTDGIILGSVKHPARKGTLKEKEYSYGCQYNGLETTIDKDGAWKVTFKGIPTNEKDLYKDTKNGIKEAKYDEKLMGTFIGIDKDGSIELSDFSKEDKQSLLINKKDGKINVTSGTVTLVIDKKEKSIKISNEITTIESKKSFKVKTEECELDASKTVKIKSAKIAIGGDGTELIDSLIKLIDAAGKLIINSPQGPCSPFNSAPTWSEIESIKSKLSGIKGSL